MYFKKLKKLLSGALTGAIMLTSLSALPVMAAEPYTITIENVTGTSEAQSDTLVGEAKFKVSVTGLSESDKITYAQVLLDFGTSSSSNMTYKAIQYIHGAENAINVNLTNKEIAKTRTLMPGFACARTPISDADDGKVDGKVDLFIITFGGGASADDKVVLDPKSSDSMIGITGTVGSVGSQHSLNVGDAVEATASTTGAESVNAEITVNIDTIENFIGNTERNPITLTLTNDNGLTYSEMLTDENKENQQKAKFVIKEDVIKGDYTVEIKANGYTTYRKENVNLSNTLNIDTDEFMPGDVNGDNEINIIDYTMFVSAYDEHLNIDNSYIDYDRNGKIEYFDRDAIKASVLSDKANGKINDTAGEKKLTVSTDKTSVKVGDTFTLTLKATDVYSYFVNGTWDNTAATLESYNVKGTDKNNTTYMVINECADGKFKFMNIVSEADSDNKIYELKFKAAEATNSFSLTFADSYAMNKVTELNETDVMKIKPENATVTITSAGEGGGGNGGGNGGGGGTGGGGGGSTGGGGGSTGGGGSSVIGGGGASTGAGAGTTTPSTETFTDIANYTWAKDSIYMLKNKGIISGVSATEFAPANNIKRGDFILILTRMLNLTNEYSENFADVPEGAYYYDALGKAKAAGIASGDGINFMPENSITRQDLITLAYRAFLNAGYITENADTTALDNFSDRAEISDYAVNAMASMVNAGIIKGSDGGVNPKGFATRAEVAVMCARLVELMK